MLPPMADKNTLSVTSCRTTRERLAPTARRTASSHRRAAFRDSNKFARLAQPISNTEPTTAPSSNATDRICLRRLGFPSSIGTNVMMASAAAAAPVNVEEAITIGDRQ